MSEVGRRLWALASRLERSGRALTGERTTLLHNGQLLATASNGSQHQDPPALAARTETGVRSTTEMCWEAERLTESLRRMARKLMR